MSITNRVRGVWPIIGQQRPTRVLTRQILNRKIPQALLFTGIDGLGKCRMAIRFAMTLNCAQRTVTPTELPQLGDNIAKTDSASFPVCENCSSCKKIFIGQHPDILHIKPAGRAIKIDQIRSLRHSLGLKPYEARHRVVIIEEAHLMTLPAANALLKILEEPPDETTLILIADKSSDMLATIVSRCQIVRFAPVSEKQMALALAERHEVDPTRAHIAAAMAGGRLDAAEEMISDQWQQERDWLLSQLITLSQGAEANKNGFIRQALALAEILANDRQMLDRMMVVIKSWFRDLAIWPFLAGEIVNRDLSTPIGKLTTGVDTDVFFSGFAAMETIENQIRKNANPRLALEATFTGRA